MTPTACPSCGAALRAGASVCDLCGTPVREAAPEAGAAVLEAAPCPRCGNVPPADSAYCNRCGTPMPAPPPALDAGLGGERPPSDVGKRALAVAAVALAAVVALYGLTLLSDRGPEPAPVAPETADVGLAAPVPEGTPALPDTLQAAADRFAEAGTASGWYESGRYYLTAAFNAAPTDPTASVQWARRAIADFERSLDLQDDPDVRFALAEAAAFDPSNPMRPVQELRAVLTAEPDHVGATYMLGERNLMIGRVDSARALLGRVLALTEPGDPVRQRAEAALASISEGGS